MKTDKPLRVAHLNPAYFSPDSYVGDGERYVDYLMQSLQCRRVRASPLLNGQGRSVFPARWYP
uniref:hypothetical protein n=1 Tax=Stenotrophomonas maltophilia TaxID=40324 RepID=UPI0019547CC0